MTDHDLTLSPFQHKHVFLGTGHDRNARGTWAVIGWCGMMMAAGIIGGSLFGFLALIADGRSNREIARRLTLSVKTIESHRATAMRKLNVTSTAAIVRYAIRNKLVEP